MDQRIVKEVTRRTQLAQVIDQMIAVHIEQRKSCHVRLKRGIMHDLISGYLGVRVSNFMRAHINSRMVAAGYPLAVQKGNLYYKHAQLKEHHGQ